MSDNPKLREALNNAETTRAIFDGLSPQEETFVRVFVERDNPYFAMRAANLQNPQYPANHIVERLCATPLIKRAIIQYRQFVAHRPKREVNLESLMMDLSEIYELAFQQGETRVALEIKRTQIALMRGNQDAGASGSKP